MKLPIYLDYHATTPVDPQVLQAMLPYFSEQFGNAASRNHTFGWGAEQSVETAREQIAQLIGATAKEIVFTSGATESTNLAILGVLKMYADKGNHIITTTVEHKATLDTCYFAQEQGAKVTFLPVDKYGRISIEDLKKAITPQTVLVTLIAASNEIGSIHPMAEIGKVCKEHGVLLHTDAVQALGRMPVDVQDWQVDLMSFSAHKVYGPKGVGALYVRRKNPRVRLAAQMHGGGHERGMRSGTLNVPGIVGFGEACRLLKVSLEQDIVHMRVLRDRLWKGLREKLSDIYLNGHPEHRLPNNLNVSFAYVEGESLMMGMKDLAVSSGSACTSASLEPSYVLKSMGVGDELAHTSIRFGVGRFTTPEEIDYALGRIVDTVNKLRSLSPLYEMVQEGIDLSTVQWTGHH